jgi:N-acetylmuramoyl-L-alanine amidase
MNVSDKQEKAVAGAQPGGAVQKCAVIVVIDPGHGDKLSAKGPRRSRRCVGQNLRK